MKNYILSILSLFALIGCSQANVSTVAKFESEDLANKSYIILIESGLSPTMVIAKDSFNIQVPSTEEISARKTLTKYNFYYSKEDINTLIESKFASLSKLELIKGNLLESILIKNKLSEIPNVIKVNVTVTGDKEKLIAVLILSLKEIPVDQQAGIREQIAGLVSENDRLTINYIIEDPNNVNTN